MSKKLFLLCLFTMIVGTGFAAQTVPSAQVQLNDGTLVEFPQPYFNQCQTLLDMAGDTGNPTVPAPLKYPFATQEAIADVKTVIDQKTESSLKRFVGGLLPLRLADVTLAADFLAVKPYAEDGEPLFDRLDVMLESFANRIVSRRSVKGLKSWFINNQQANFDKSVALIGAKQGLNNAVAIKIVQKAPFNCVKIIKPAVLACDRVEEAWLNDEGSQVTVLVSSCNKDVCKRYDIKTGQLLEEYAKDTFSVPELKIDGPLFTAVGFMSTVPCKGHSLMVVPREDGTVDVFNIESDRPVKIQTLRLKTASLGKARLSDDESSIVSVSKKEYPNNGIRNTLFIWQRGARLLENRGGNLRTVTIEEAQALYQPTFSK